MRSAAVNLLAYSAALFAAVVSCGGGGKREPTNTQLTRPLVIYLHGMFDGDAPDERASERVLERFREAGFDVWAPRGRVGLCDWAENVKQAVCWPSDERALPIAREIVDEWRVQLSTQRPFVVVGFSNGGAFTILLAVHGLVAGCGFASMHGFPAGMIHAESGPHAPILLIGGKEAAWEAGQMTTTTAQLSALAWPHEAKMHDGAHVVSDEDLTDVIAFARHSVQSSCSPGMDRSVGVAAP